MQEFQKAGWANARALLGGWKAWQAAGLPTVSKEEAAFR
jgi:3-mercaptopyruvate sulfurtransferase SseA